jgi:Fe-S cluster assembly iron-binding protein IscA
MKTLSVEKGEKIMIQISDRAAEVIKEIRAEQGDEHLDVRISVVPG